MIVNQLSSSIPCTTVRSKKQPMISSLPDQKSQPFTNNSEKASFGMYVTEKHLPPKSASERFIVTRTLCLRNAKLLRDIGEKSKADTWTLLAQVRDLHMMSF
jgi:hypothetical protein